MVKNQILVTTQEKQVIGQPQKLNSKLRVKNNDPTPAQAATYAQVAAKAPMKKLLFSKAKMVKVQSLLSPRPPPLEFTKLWLEITRSDLIKSCKTSREVTIMIKEVLKSIGIGSEVVQFSKIGNSILEIYVTKSKLSWVKAHLKSVELL